MLNIFLASRYFSSVMYSGRISLSFLILLASRLGVKYEIKCSLSDAYTRRAVTSGVTIPQECHPHVYPRMVWAILHSLRKHSPDGVARARWRTSGSAYYLSIDPEKRLNWHSWLTYSGRFTHISGHPSATWSSVEERKFAGQRLCIILSSYAEYLTIEYLISLRCCIVGTVRYTLIWQNEVYCAHFTTICWNTSEGSLFSSPTCTKCRRCR